MLGDGIYTGITKQDLEKRLAQHVYQKKPFEKLVQQTTEKLTRNQARAVEQQWIEKGPNLYNKINSIAKNSEFYAEAKKWAEKYIKDHGIKW